MFKAQVAITLRPAILDPQGKATQHALTELGFTEVDQVRMGKYAELWIDAPDAEQAEAAARKACEQLLANPVMEDFHITVEPVERVAG